MPDPTAASTALPGASRTTITDPDGAAFEVSKWAVCDGCKVEDHDHCVMPISKGVCCCD